MALFIGQKKYLVASFFVMICASASLAAANDPGMSNSAAQTMHPTIDSLQNISVGINSDCVTGYFTKFRGVSAALERRDMPIVPTSESLEEAAAITLHKDGDKGIWSLAPSLCKYSFNLLDDIKNFQVLLRYRF